MQAVDVLAQAIRINPRTFAAGELAERYIAHLLGGGYTIVPRYEWEHRTQAEHEVETRVASRKG